MTEFPVQSTQLAGETTAQPNDPRKVHIGNSAIAKAGVMVDLAIERPLIQAATGLAKGETADPKTHLNSEQELQAATMHKPENALPGHVITMTPPEQAPFQPGRQ